uniref:NADH-ubiquinone oxidoreductase chain 4 n=1 Tax=Planorbella duryi TaxID=129831 RepID=A0A1S6PTN6_9GAST|nr:NADH dehydrogenase subunit 4 [Planorbella duryi]
MFIKSWMINYLGMLMMCILAMMNFNLVFSWGMEFFFVSNNISCLLIFLSIMLCMFSLISSPDMKKSKFILCLSSLLVILLIVFSVNNVLLFYVFFEASLIPTLLLVVSWGYQPERLQAGTYMMVYTVCASLPLLLILLYRCKIECTYMMFFGNSNNFDSLCFMIYLAFLVKLPMYPFHLWLPKAHVEASLAGSMMLAGVLLKLGGYGLIQMSMMFDISGSKSLTLLLIMSMSMWGGLLSSMMCLRQTDMKAFVAYSSVGHMALVIVGILNDQVWGILSSLITMYAHGLSSSALFCMTYFTYSKVHTRSVMYIKGLLQLYPMIAFFWFLLCAINMAVPPSLNLLGEMFIIPSLYSISIMFIIIMGFMVFISGVYNMYLYTLINHGTSSKYILAGSSMQNYQMLSLVFHLIPMLLIFKLKLFL